MGVLQGKTVFFDNSRQNMEMENVVMLERDHPIIQELTADGKEITGIKIRVYTETNLDLYSLKVVLAIKSPVRCFMRVRAILTVSKKIRHFTPS